MNNFEPSLKQFSRFNPAAFKQTMWNSWIDLLQILITDIIYTQEHRHYIFITAWLFFIFIWQVYAKLFLSNDLLSFIWPWDAQW